MKEGIVVLSKGVEKTAAATSTCCASGAGSVRK